MHFWILNYFFTYETKLGLVCLNNCPEKPISFNRTLKIKKQHLYLGNHPIKMNMANADITGNSGSDLNDSHIDNVTLRSLVNHIPGVIYRCKGDEFLSLVFMSDGIVKLTGYPIQYFTANRVDGFFKLVIEEDREMLRRTLAKAIDNQEKFELEYRLINSDGEVRWVYESGQGVYDAMEKISYVDGCMFDITNRKETEIALAISEMEVNKLALVAQKTTNSVMITDADQNIIWVNDGYLNKSGYSLEELKQKKIGYSHFGKGLDGEVEKRIRFALASKQAFKEELISYTKNGNEICLEVDCHPLLDEQGKHIGFMAIENDITQLKKTSKEQVELLQRLTLASDSAGIGIFEIDLANNLAIWDDRMYEIYGYPKDTIVSLFKIFGKAVHPDDAEMMRKIFGDFLSNRKELNGAVYRIILPDGKIQFIEAHAIIKKSESGRVVSIIGTNRNVTEDVLVQEKLKMQNKVLRDIAFIQSHEVRKPLANIMGIIEILNQNGSFNDLEIFNHLVESAKELDTQIRSIVKKANEMDDDVFR